jgi:hypothetical protein
MLEYLQSKGGCHIEIVYTRVVRSNNLINDNIKERIGSQNTGAFPDTEPLL